MKYATPQFLTVFETPPLVMLHAGVMFLIPLRRSIARKRTALPCLAPPPPYFLLCREMMCIILMQLLRIGLRGPLPARCGLLWGASCLPRCSTGWWPSSGWALGRYTCHACPHSHDVATVGAIQVTTVCPSSLWHFSLIMPAEGMDLRIMAGNCTCTCTCK